MPIDVEYSEHQLAQLEAAVAAGSPEDARLAFRRYLFSTVDSPVEGSATEAVAVVAEAPSGRAVAAAVILRALGAGVFQDLKAAHLARHVVSIAEGAMPEFCAFLGVQPKSQTFEKFNILRSAHETIVQKLEPLRTPYASIVSLLAARPRIANALSHGQVRAYLRPYHIGEVEEAIDHIFRCLARAQQLGATLGADVGTCKRGITEARELVEARPSFLTKGFLAPFLDNASGVLEDFLDAMHGRLAAEIVRAEASEELQKRYPLHEEGRELRIVVPFRNEGPGGATDVTFRISSPTAEVAVSNEAVSLGTVPPGEFSIAFDALVTSPCPGFQVEIEVGWNEIGGIGRREELFAVRALAQRSDIDWADYKHWNPYSTEPAQGAEFYGRVEQVETLVSRLLQRPMEPSYITGQKRVGKTSLAKAAVSEAVAQDPTRKLTEGYILWGRVAHEDPRRALRQLGEAIERIIKGALPVSDRLSNGDYDGTLSPLLDLLDLAHTLDPERRFVVILDEFDEMPEDLYLKGNLADTLFANIRALTTTPNFCLLLVGGENMPFVMERQGQKLNKFNRVNLTYFSRVNEWDDFVRLVRGPSEAVLTWHNDAVSEVFNLTNGNPYFSKIICKGVTARAVTERDGDVTAEEVQRWLTNGVTALDTNAFMHLWEDGTRGPIEDRDRMILKRRRTLAAIARCLRAGRHAMLANIQAHRGGAAIEEREIPPVLHNFADRGVLLEDGPAFVIALPIFARWLIEVGLSRLANDGLSEELASLQQHLEDEAYVKSAEIVALAGKWGPYRGAQIGPETVRAWLDQRASYRDQRLLFDILKCVRVVRQDEIYARLRQAGSVIRERLGVYARKSNTDRRSDVVLTYIDGEGKSGQRYAADFAEENKIHVAGILSPSSFSESFAQFQAKFGTPKALVIVDDLVGTGGTLSEKVAAFFGQHGTLFDGNDTHVEIYAHFATKSGQRRVLDAIAASAHSNVEFRAGELLADDQLAFHPPQGVFATQDEYERAKAIATDIGVTIYRNHPLGIGGQALLLVLPNTVPNNSLPMLHSASKDPERPWSPLFGRIANG